MSGGGLATVAALALLVGAAALACDGDDSPPTTTPISTATVSPTSTATEVPTSTVSSTPTPTPSPEVATREVTGLDAPLGELPEVETLPFPEMPASSFSPWDGQSMMLYDVVEMTERNLGPGQFADFSPDGTRFAWVAGEPGLGNEAFLLELPDGEPSSLGPARTIRWLSNDEVIVHLPNQPPNQNPREIVNVETGERRPDDEPPAPDMPGGRIEVGSYRLDRFRTSGYPSWRSVFRLTDLRGVLPPLEFEATEAALTSGGRLFVLAPPLEPSGPPANMGPHIETGLANVFEIDIETAEARLMATTMATAPTTPFVESSRYNAWADNFCNLPEAGPSRTLVYDRATERLIAFDRAEWVVLTERDELGVGAFGPRALLDLDTFEYNVVIDPNGFDITWSPDYRYAARGFAGGHGGLCG